LCCGFQQILLSQQSTTIRVSNSCPPQNSGNALQRHIAKLGGGEGGTLDRSGWRKVFSVYDDVTKTIYLREGWTGSTAAELSILVHEMVHHLQNLGRLKFQCLAAREKLAYEAQEQWLRLFGSDLWRDFEIDQFTLLLTTRCYDR
jgi:hypothetical protein